MPIISRVPLSASAKFNIIDSVTAFIRVVSGEVGIRTSVNLAPSGTKQTDVLLGAMLSTETLGSALDSGDRDLSDNVLLATSTSQSIAYSPLKTLPLGDTSLSDNVIISSTLNPETVPIRATP